MDVVLCICLTVAVHGAMRARLLAVAFNLLPPALIARFTSTLVFPHEHSSTNASIPCSSYPPSLLHRAGVEPLWLIFRGVIIDGVGRMDINIRGGGSVHCVAHGGSIADWGCAG